MEYILDFIKAFALGIVEGVTEFLPISSTGHLIIVNQWISFSESFTKVFDIVIQLGAVLAIVIYFWSRIWPFGENAIRNKEIFYTWKMIVVGVMPALAIGALFGSFIERNLFNPWTVSISLIIGGLVLIYIDKEELKPSIISTSDITWKKALCIGLIQCLAMIPGTSRSAVTIIGSMLLGASKSLAVEFSFFLAIPTLIAASVYSISKYGIDNISNHELLVLAIGFVSAFIVALVIVNFFIKYIQSHNFKLFAYYRIVLGLLIIIYFHN